MRVFVTGATGFIGSAIVQELIDAGHQVLGLTRSDAGAKALVAAGAEVHRGNLEDIDSLKSGAAMADGVIHTAFIHDFSNFKASCETDRRVIEALGSALAGTSKPLIITSGIAIVSPGSIATEDKTAAAGSASIPRIASEEAAAAMAARGVNVSVVRLPPSVHDDGDHGFVPALIGIAREKGAAAYVNDGSNRWSSVHRLDAARVYRLALEKGSTGAFYHAIGDEGIPVKKIAEVIGQQLNLPVIAKSTAEAGEHFGWLAHFIVLDIPASSQKTREALGWAPSHISLITDLEQGSYFK